MNTIVDIILFRECHRCYRAYKKSKRVQNKFENIQFPRNLVRSSISDFIVSFPSYARDVMSEQDHRKGEAFQSVDSPNSKNHHGSSFTWLHLSNTCLTGSRIRLCPAAPSTNPAPYRRNSAQELRRGPGPTSFPQGSAIQRRRKTARLESRCQR